MLLRKSVPGLQIRTGGSVQGLLPESWRCHRIAWVLRERRKHSKTGAGVPGEPQVGQSRGLHFAPCRCIGAVSSLHGVYITTRAYLTHDRASYSSCYLMEVLIKAPQSQCEVIRCALVVLMRRCRNFRHTPPRQMMFLVILSVHTGILYVLGDQFKYRKSSSSSCV